MPYLALLVTVVVLAIFTGPAMLARREANPSARDEFVGSGHVLPRVIQNSLIVYSIGLATLGPFFAQGAGGGLRQAIIQAAFIGLGLSLIYALRRSMLNFLASVLDRTGSITVHGFIARQHGNDPRVGTVAAALTICALSGFMVCVALGVAALLEPMLSGYSGLTDMVIEAVLAVTLACVLLSGHTGIMHATQLQLGLLYLGLFGSIPFLLYQQGSELGLFPMRGNVAVALIAVVCALMLFYRRGRYVDSNSLRYGASISAAASGNRESVWLRMLSRSQKILNASISFLIVTTFGASLFVLGVSAYLLYVEGVSTVPADGVVALLTGSNVSEITLLSLVLLWLFHPVVDIVNWQRLAVFAREHDWSYFGEGQWSAAFKSVCATYSIETPLLVLLICLFGTLAGLTPETADQGNVMQTFAAQLIEQDDLVATAILLGLLLGLLAMAVATISASFCACLYALRYDIVPTWIAVPAGANSGVQAERWTRIAGAGIGVVVFAAFCLADSRFEMTFKSAGFLTMVLGLGCLQLSFAPLVLVPLVIGSDGKSRAAGIVSPGWALAVMGVGAAVGAGATAAYFSTGYDPWQWAAVPGCLGSGALVFAIARLRFRRIPSVGLSAGECSGADDDNERADADRLDRNPE